MHRTAHGLAADFAAALSGSAAAASWITTANGLLQLVATAVAIAAGVYAIKWHRIRINDMKRKLAELEEVVVEVKEKVDEDPS